MTRRAAPTRWKGRARHLHALLHRLLRHRPQVRRPRLTRPDEHQPTIPSLPTSPIPPRTPPPQRLTPAPRPSVQIFSSPSARAPTGRCRSARDKEERNQFLQHGLNTGKTPYKEGQSIGVIANDVDKNGKPHKVRLYSIASSANDDFGNSR